MSEGIVFEKMHGIGNDFVLIDNRQQKLNITKKIIVSLANRHTGIGFDQLLLINKSDHAECDAAYRFFNPDGSEAEQCGNGQRCISLYLHRLNPHKNDFCLSGLSGITHSKIITKGIVRVNMGTIKSICEQTVANQACYQVDFGNPHLVHIVQNIEHSDLFALNQQFTQKFPNGINFEIVEIINKENIRLRVYERGTGETLACGSGACATVAALQYAQILTKKVNVILPGGSLMVESDQDNIFLTGSATHVFTGEFLI